MTGSITTNIRLAYAGIFVLLLVSTVIARLLMRARPSPGVDTAVARINSWWLMAVLFIIATLGNRFTSMFLFCLVSFLALKEYFTLMPIRRVDRTLLFWVYAANPVQYYWVGSERFWMFVFFIPVYVFFFLPIWMVLSGKPRGFMRAAGTLHWGLMVTVFGLSHLAYLMLLPGDNAARGTGAGLVIFLVLLTELNNVFQYVWRRTLGGRKIIPRVNPAKTWSGLVGGVLSTSVLAMLLAPYITPMGTAGALAAGVLIGLGGFLGDITISSLKRDLRIRQTGHYIPGHGGVLDRVDSLTYTAPIFFYYVRAVYFG